VKPYVSMLLRGSIISHNGEEFKKFINIHK